MYRRNYESTGYAPFDQISTANAGYPRPALKGADFADPSYDFHVKDIFNFVAKLMPTATPGSLNARTGCRDHGVHPAAKRLSRGNPRA
jgi:hypothetical protein